MHIEHIAIRTEHLERLRTFYTTYFDARAGEKYMNPTTQFESYFLSFASGARLELMRIPAISDMSKEYPAAQFFGYVHLACSLGSPKHVDELTQSLRNDGYQVVSGPRYTGDGYYESCVLDPDGNRIELTE